jgi:hypothetical protein
LRGAAGLEIGDTARLETCATQFSRDRFQFTLKRQR